MSSKFEANKLKISEEAKNLAENYGYLPYMIERYLSMFDPEEIKNFLEANERYSPLSFRVNTLKSTPHEVSAALSAKGYNLKQSEFIDYAYSIESDFEKINLNNEQTTISNDESIGFERDSTTLGNLEWGRPSFMDEEHKKEEEKRQEAKSQQIFRGKQIGTLGSTHEYLMGKYYIQDIASMFPPIYLNPSPDDLVIDMSAAPGGKTTHLAQLMGNQGYIFAIDNNKLRIKSLVYNLRRCGIRNTSVLLMNANSLHKQNFSPDKILLDAPCTGEGLIRDDPSRKTSKSLTDITGMMRKQYSLLQSAIKAVKQGGMIMYSTCSIAPEENEFVIQKALDSFNNIEIVPIEDDWALPGYINVFGMQFSEELLKARRLFPHIHNTIGFFYCLLRKI
jgi:tRNA (cytosine40_48-C5)-methyltransferase